MSVKCYWNWTSSLYPPVVIFFPSCMHACITVLNANQQIKAKVPGLWIGKEGERRREILESPSGRKLPERSWLSHLVLAKGGLAGLWQGSGAPHHWWRTGTQGLQARKVKIWQQQRCSPKISPGELQAVEVSLHILGFHLYEGHAAPATHISNCIPFPSDTHMNCCHLLSSHSHQSKILVMLTAPTATTLCPRD